MSSTHKHAPEDAQLLADAWGIIANVQAGHWAQERPEWQDQASKWRDDYYRWLAHRSGEAQIELAFRHQITVRADDPAENGNGNGNGGNWFWSTHSEMFLSGTRDQPVAVAEISGWEADKVLALAKATHAAEAQQSRLTMRGPATSAPPVPADQPRPATGA